MKNIIVVGYPKSGSTWITRLTAELVGCPVTGFWNSNHIEIAQEGEDRISDFRCFKAHHRLRELGFQIDSNDNRIIYVVRDPRDIAVSGSHYFNFIKGNKTKKIFKKIPYGMRLYHILYSERYKIDQMINAILKGSEQVHYWCRIPWEKHFKAYLDKGFLFIRYEDMLASPEKECKRILEYLSLDITDVTIKNAIINQSFETKKMNLVKKGEAAKTKFMHVGKNGQWKEKFSKKQKEIFIKHLSKELEFFSYETV